MSFPQHLLRELDAMSALGLTVYPVASQAKRLHVVAALETCGLKPALDAFKKQSGFRYAEFEV
jgi:hypothetical protein